MNLSSELTSTAVRHHFTKEFVLLGLELAILILKAKVIKYREGNHPRSDLEDLFPVKDRNNANNIIANGSS
jgi:hypothetical protein